MKKLSLFIYLAFGPLVLCFPQQDSFSAKNSLTVMFYNVENLFDTSDDSLTTDEEFLPQSPKKWDREKYFEKISDIAQVISSVNEKELPSLVGLAEVENSKVLEDLVSAPKLKKGKYRIVHFDSKDERGIDVALLYNTDEIELIESKTIPVSFGKEVKDLTRDILYAKCRIKGDRIVNVFVNHWPSRSPGQEESEMKRVMAALTLRKEVDNILNIDNEAAILIMGDFNDEPTNRSLFQILNATNKLKNAHYRDLYNLMFDIHNLGGEGSITYNEKWQMFDQIIVSQSLLSSGGGYHLSPTGGKVFKNSQVLVRDQVTGTQIINRTYSGDKYLGGVSDHLPVYAIMKKEQ
jgi:predicted extracellular nuclease